MEIRCLTADTHPDHDTICKFRRKNLKAFRESFVDVLELASELKLLKLGNFETSDDDPVRRTLLPSKRLSRSASLSSIL